MKSYLKNCLPLACLLILLGCSSQSYEQSVCALVDVSGTYADETTAAVRTIKAGILPAMLPGDGLTVVRIDGGSYEASNIEASIRLAQRPSAAHAGRLDMARKLDKMVARKERSKHTDISGALMLCADRLRESESGSQVLVVFSDLEEDLPKGTRRTFQDGEFDAMNLVAINVKQLRGDNADPQLFRDRLDGWKKRTSNAGAYGWQVVQDPARLQPALEQLRR